MSNAYTFSASNVVIGETRVPGYEFKTRVPGVLGLAQLGDTARVEIDGNVHAHGARLTNIDAERVLITGPNGSMTSASFPGIGVGNASYMNSGTVDPSHIVGDYLFGNIVVNNTLIATDIGGNIDAINLVSGTIDDSRLDGTYAFQTLDAAHVVATNATGNVDATLINDGLLSPDRVVGQQYGVDALQLTGNLIATGGSALTTVSAEVDASSVVSGVLSNDRLVGPYSVARASTANALVATHVVLPTQIPDRPLVSNGSTVVSSVTTAPELDHVRNVHTNIQDQLDEIQDGLVVGNTITHLDATQVKLGTLHDDRLQGPYTFSDLTLTNGLDATQVSASLDASDLQTGTLQSGRIQGTYTDVSSLAVTERLSAIHVLANLNATDLVTGTLDDDRLAGPYAFDTLETTSVDAAWALGNVHTSNIVSGTIPINRFNFNSVHSNLVASGTHILGNGGNPWTETYTVTTVLDDLEIGTAIRRGDASMQLDLQTTNTSIVPASHAYTIGTSVVPWSNVFITDVSVDTLSLSGQMYDDQGTPFSFDMENVPLSIVPKPDTSVSFGSYQTPWETLTASNLVTGALSLTGPVHGVQSDLVPGSSGHSLGTTTQRWDDLVAANVSGALDGNTVGDLWAQIEYVVGDIAALDGVVLPNEVNAFRFIDDESTGLGLVGGNAIGGLDLVVGGNVLTTFTPGTVHHAGNVVPIHANDANNTEVTASIGGHTASWSDVYASQITTSAGTFGPVNSNIVANVVTCSGTTVTSSVDVAHSLEAGTLEGPLDATFLTGTVPDGRFGGTYSITNLVVSNTLTLSNSVTCGHIVPSANAIDLGSSDARFRDVYVSNASIHLGQTTLSEVDDIVTVSSNLIVLDGVSGDGLRPALAISNLQITDSNWTVVDDTAISSTGANFIVNGIGFAPGTLVKIDTTNAISTSFVDPTQLRVQVSARPSGTYDVSVVRADTKTVTVPSALHISNAVTWTTAGNLGTVEHSQPFSLSLEAESDSNVTFSTSNLTTLPDGVTLDAVTGTLSGTIADIQTLFSFEIVATDEEHQDTSQTFFLFSN